MIETIRSKGVSDQELLMQIETKDVSPWREFNPDFDFFELVTLAEQDPDQFKAIILEGYKVKFVTIYGLKNFLKLKFDKIEEQDYQLTEKGITNLQVDHQQLSKIQQFLSNNWTIQEIASEKSDPSHKVIKIELI
jgi:hypothetical protein